MLKQWIKDKLKKFWLVVLFTIAGGGYAFAQIPAVDTTIPIEKTPANISFTKNEIPADRVVDFIEIGDVIKFAYYTDVVPPLHEGEDINLRKNNSWTKTTGLNSSGVVLGEYEKEGKTFVKNEIIFFSLGAWVWKGDRTDPNNWRQLEYATSTKENFDKTNARTNVVVKRFQGQKVTVWNESLLSVIFGKYVFAACPSSTEFCPESGTGGTTVDGKLAKSNDASWANTRTASSANEVAVSESSSWVGVQSNNPGPKPQINRLVWYFDTSAIPATNNIDSATLQLYEANNLTGGDADAFDYLSVVQVQGNLVSADNSITGTDYNLTKIGGADPAPKGSDDIDIINDLIEDAYNTFTFNATGLAWIARDSEAIPTGATNGITYLGMREGHDIEDEEYGGGADTFNIVLWFMADNTGIDKDPLLTVTHSVAAAEDPPDDGFFIFN